MATPQLARRLQKEIGSMRSAPAGITGGPVGDDLLNWRCSIDGPDDSPFKSGKFPVAIKFPDDYPFKPPVVKFAVKVYHPNVDDDGSICVGLLKTDTWKPVTSVLESKRHYRLICKLKTFK
jgi:ubiquitin-conjugating enzyme E2 D/E